MAGLKAGPMSDRPAFRQIGIIGTGRVGRALGLALAPHSAAPILIHGRNPDNVGRAAADIGRAAPADGLPSLSFACDLIVLAVADDALASVIADLAATDLSAFVCHVSGRSGAALLDPLRQHGAITAAVHPAMTFTGEPMAEVARMIGARFAVSAPDSKALLQARRLVALVGGVAVEVPESHRALYHAALCHAANHLVTLIAGASDALGVAGVLEPGALLAPLARAALENSLQHGIEALSGPLLRGDRETIDDHLDALAVQDPDLLPAYRAMALETLEAMDRHGMPVHAPDLRDVLSHKSAVDHPRG